MDGCVHGSVRVTPDRPRRRLYRRSGFYKLKRELSGSLDGRSTVALALREMRDGIISDLGGPGAISTAQQALVDVACRSRLLLDSVDGFILQQPRLVNGR